MNYQDNWRLCYSGTAHIIITSSVYSGPERRDCKIYLTEHGKNADSILKRIHGHKIDSSIIRLDEINLDNIKVRLSKDKLDRLEISSPNFPGGYDIWYRLMNYSNDGRPGIDSVYIENLMSIVGQNKLDINTREFDGEFEVVVSPDNYSGQVLLVSNNMIEYNWAFEHKARELVINSSRKSKTIDKPGHVYLTSSGNFIFLGEFYNWKEDQKVKLISRLDNAKFKSVKELVLNKKFDLGYGKYVYLRDGIIFNPSPVIAPRIGMSIDGGVELINDLPSIESIQSDLVIRYYNETKKIDYVGNTLFDTSEFIGLLYMLTLSDKNGNIPSLSEEALNCLRELYRHLVMVYIHNYIDPKTVVWEEEENNIYHSITSRLLKHSDMDCKYYLSILETLGIDYKKETKEVFDSLISGGKFKILTIEDYIKRVNVLDKYTSYVSINYAIQGKTDLGKYFANDSELFSVVKDITKDADKNYGLNVDGYSTVSVGAKQESSVTRNIKISLENIVDWFGGVSKMPDIIKQSLMYLDFKGIIIGSKLGEEL